jgi:polyphosphate kinase
VADIFNYLTGYSKQTEFKKLIVAPVDMREKFLFMINREIENVKAGGEGKLIFKLNSVVDPALISAMYEASSAGVKIKLIVRGICCLIPGVKDLSENIEVRSIVGRYLEHSRIFYFHNNGADEIYLSSADFMQRNLDRRVEIAFPIEDQKLKDEINRTLIKATLKDNVKARILCPDMQYHKIEYDPQSKRIDSQEWLMNHTIKASGNYSKTKL